jgi:DNA repair protein RecN (Recombination protein N)
VFNSLTQKKKELNDMDASLREREARLEILSFAINEIDDAALKIGETDELTAEAGRLRQFEKLSSFVTNAVEVFCDGTPSAVGLLRKSSQAVENAEDIDGKLQPLAKRIESIYFEAEDIARELHSYGGNLIFNEGRLEFVEERLALLHKLAKKYALGTKKDGGKQSAELLWNEAAVEEKIFAYEDNAKNEMEGLQNAEENRESKIAEIKEIEKQVVLRSKALSQKRKLAAERMAKTICDILGELGMSGAKYSVRLATKVSQLPEASPKKTYGPWGEDDVEFYLSANRGEAEKELIHIASGGELSRIMLAIKSAFTGNAAEARLSQETLVFDEIDTGIGGEVAVQVGQYLEKLSRNRQVFCITHLASIASRAQNHLKVLKGSSEFDEGRISTRVNVLNFEERVREIARMLSGADTEAAMLHARELLSV